MICVCLQDMEVTLIAFGIARDILQERKLNWELVSGSTIGDLKAALHATYPDFDKLRSLRCAVNEEYVSDTHTVQEGDEIVLIPPVSGG
ncbi:MAG: MoaD/ThiS family protein [Saprospiraceae bacterium]|nr:MoaD/ThiS family protein [Saprospiraceae bacterium]